MSKRGLAAGGIVAVVVATALAAGSPASQARDGGCSRATATRLVRQYRLNPFLLPHPVAQVLCGPFTGPGSRAMAITVGVAPTCWPIQSWAVFRVRSGAWRPVLRRNEFVAPPLVADGSDIRETLPVFRRGDSRCDPSGGTRTVVWRWNGRRLVRTGAGQTEHLTSYLSPDRQVWCTFADFAPIKVSCGSPAPSTKTPAPQAHAAELRRNGALTLCNADVCFQNWDDHAPLLRAGQTNVRSGFRCAAGSGGITCTVTAGAGAGKGFRINASGVTRIGP